MAATFVSRPSAASGSGVILAVLAALAAPAARAEPQIHDLAVLTRDCMQEDTSVLSIRACSTLLGVLLASDPARAGIYKRRARAWLKEEEPEETIADYTRALALAAGDIAALSGRASALSVTQDHAKAIEDWTAVIALATDQQVKLGAYIARGEAEMAAGRRDAALADFALALTVAPGNVRAHKARATIFAGEGDRAKALDEFAQAETAAGGSYELHLARGQIAAKLEDIPLAIASYRTALTFNSRGGEARRALRRLGVDFTPE